MHFTNSFQFSNQQIEQNPSPPPLRQPYCTQSREGQPPWASLSSLVCLGCHNKYHRLGSLNNSGLVSHISGSWNVKINMSLELASSEASLLGWQVAVFLLPLHAIVQVCVPVCTRGLSLCPHPLFV